MHQLSILIAAVSVFIACGSAQQAAETPKGGDWRELKISWDYGPCPNDGRSCHQALTVTRDGGFTASDEKTDETKRLSSLQPDETRELQHIVDAGFVAKLGAFSCSPQEDATIRIEIDGKKQEIGGCIRASEERARRARS